MAKQKKSNPQYGKRYDKGKIDLTQLSPLVQELESRIFMFGEVKYERDNWKFFKKTEKEARLEFEKSLKRHMLAYTKGQFIDEESKQPHLSAVIWNTARLLDLHYYGMTHMKDGKDLFHQPYRHELPPIITKENYKEIFGIELKTKK